MCLGMGGFAEGWFTGFWQKNAGFGFLSVLWWLSVHMRVKKLPKERMIFPLQRGTSLISWNFSPSMCLLYFSCNYAWWNDIKGVAKFPVKNFFAGNQMQVTFSSKVGNINKLPKLRWIPGLIWLLALINYQNIRHNIKIRKNLPFYTKKLPFFARVMTKNSSSCRTVAALKEGCRIQDAA